MARLERRRRSRSSCSSSLVSYSVVDAVDSSRKWGDAVPITIVLVVGAGLLGFCVGRCNDSLAREFVRSTIGIAARLGQSLLPGTGGLHEEINFVLGAAYRTRLA